jgi:peptide/nickel transport system ATP-binding protein
MGLIGNLVADHGIGLVLISHDLSVLASSCQRVAVMYAGSIVEEGPAQCVFDGPQHPYTSALAAAFPKVGDPASRLAPRGLGGDPPDPAELPTGCPFHPRCAVATDKCPTAELQLWPAGDDRRAACIHVLSEAAR